CRRTAVWCPADRSGVDRASSRVANVGRPLDKERVMPKTVSFSQSAGAVRLTMSAKVANDLGALQKGLKSLAERMGHPQCATGCDILHLATEREFTLGADVSLNPQPLPPREFGAPISLP